MATRRVTDTEGYPSVAVGGDVFSSWRSEVGSAARSGDTVTVRARASRALGRVCDVTLPNGDMEVWALAKQQHMTPRTGPSPLEAFLDRLGS